MQRAADTWGSVKGFSALAGLIVAMSGCYAGISGGGAQASGGDESEGGAGTGVGESGDEGDSSDTTPSTPLPEHPSSVIRLLSRRELGNAIEALVGFRPDALAMLPSDNTDLGYDRIVESQTISALHEDAHIAIADEIAERLLQDELATITPECTPSGALDVDGPELGVARRPCLEAFVDALVPLAFRRPLADDERTALLQLYDDAQSYRDGARQIVRAIFRSPSFLFLVEYGDAASGDGEAIDLTDWEAAARISFALCETLPDDELRAAAAAGELRDPEAITAHAERLLQQPCARETLRSFWAQWLHLAELTGLTRDPTYYPDFDPALGDAMRRETEGFLDWLMWEDPGSLRDVFAARFSVLDADIGALYGIDGLGDTATPTDLPDERRGVLTHPSVLAVTSDPDATSPVERGVFVLRTLLCQSLPPRPKDVQVTEPALDDAKTTRERWAQHSQDPACSYCHQILDPVGFAMEDFDAIGRHRDVENGLPIDAHGGIPSLGVEDGSIVGAAQLSELVADRAELRYCFARQWTRFALGRLEAQTDAPTLGSITDIVADDGTLMDAFASVASTPAFRQRAIGESP